MAHTKNDAQFWLEETPDQRRCPPTSASERRAAEYVQETLSDLGYTDVQEHPFKSQNSYGWIVIPAALAGAIGMTIETPKKVWGQLIGGALSLSGAQTAAQNPELGVTGREMLSLDEVSNLRDHGYAALLISSHGPDGWLAHWHRATDTLENLDRAGLERAATYTWALLQTIDDQPAAA